MLQGGSQTPASCVARARRETPAHAPRLKVALPVSLRVHAALGCDAFLFDALPHKVLRMFIIKNSLLRSRGSCTTSDCEPLVSAQHHRFSRRRKWGRHTTFALSLSRQRPRMWQKLKSCGPGRAPCASCACVGAKVRRTSARAAAAAATARARPTLRCICARGGKSDLDPAAIPPESVLCWEPCLVEARVSTSEGPSLLRRLPLPRDSARNLGT